MTQEPNTTSTIDPSTFITDPTIGFRRRAAALALPLGFASQIVANTAYSIATINGGSDQTGAAALDLYGTQSTAIGVSTVAVIVGVALIIPGVFAAARVMRRGSTRLAFIAALALAVGYLGYLVNVGSNFLIMALYAGGVDAAAAIDASSSTPLFLVAGLLFVLGNLGGSVLLGIAMLRSRGVPRWAGILVFAWPVLHITNLIVGSEWFAVAGGVLQVIGLSAVTAIAFRTSNAEWASRG